MADDIQARQALYNGFGDTMARGFELAITPMLFGLIGYALDRWLGLLPILTIVFAAFALAGTAVKTYYGYAAAMDSAQAGAAWSASAGRSRRPAARPARGGSVARLRSAEIAGVRSAEVAGPDSQATGS